jgi:hypothetical protein
MPARLPDQHVGMIPARRDPLQRVRATFGFPFPCEEGSRWSAALGGSTLLDQGMSRARAKALGTSGSGQGTGRSGPFGSSPC